CCVAPPPSAVAPVRPCTPESLRARGSTGRACAGTPAPAAAISRIESRSTPCRAAGTPRVEPWPPQASSRSSAAGQQETPAERPAPRTDESCLGTAHLALAEIATQLHDCLVEQPE